VYIYAHAYIYIYIYIYFLFFSSRNEELCHEEAMSRLERYLVISHAHEFHPYECTSLDAAELNIAEGNREEGR